MDVCVPSPGAVRLTSAPAGEATTCAVHGQRVVRAVPACPQTKCTELVQLPKACSVLLPFPKVIQ